MERGDWIIFVISVIFPTRNRADYLSIALTSLEEQSLSPDKFEVLIVDNGSSDHTADVTRQAGTLLPNLRYYFEPEVGLHAGRHRGLIEAKGDVLVYADDDIRATPTWLEAIAENFANPEISMLGGNNYPDFQGQIPRWLNKLWARPAMGGQGIVHLSVLSLPEGRRPISPYFVWGCNFSIRKQVVLDAGGFHPDGMPKELIRFRGDGETHISRYVLENNLSCVFDSRASVYHAVTAERMTFEYFRQRAYNQGISDSFTQLRDSKKQRLLSGHPAKFVRRLLGKIHNLTKWDVKNGPELKKLTRLIREGHQEGFEYHQRVYQEDPEVRAWVHKRDYFDHTP